MAAASARMLGCERIFMIDHQDYRLKFAAETYGVAPINFDHVVDPAQHIIDKTRQRGGIISVPGLYAAFLHGFLFGDAFEKGLQFRMGQTHVQRFMPELLEHIGNGRLNPDVIVSHQLRPGDAARGYELFDQKQEDCRKVVLIP